MRMRYKTTSKGFLPYGKALSSGGLSKNKKRKKKMERLSRRINRRNKK